MAISIDSYPDLDHIFDVHFNNNCIRTIVTHEATKATDWISEIEQLHRHRLNKLIVGLDVEWRPSFSRHQNPVATLQLCVGQNCLIFQLLHCSTIPASLSRFLADSGYTFVGVGIGEDVEKLVGDYDLSVNNAVDLCALAAREADDPSLKNAGLKGLALRYMGAEMEKPRRVRLGRWDQEVLTLEQIQYACVDAFVSFEIGRILNAYSQ